MGQGGSEKQGFWVSGKAFVVFLLGIFLTPGCALVPFYFPLDALPPKKKLFFVLKKKFIGNL
jgi:hypothetical protein